MKRYYYIVGIIAIFAFFTSCEKEAINDLTDSVSAHSSLENPENKLTGFDQWGYNWNAHQFNGYVINAWFGDEVDPAAPWYKKEPPFDGDVFSYQEAYPEVLEYPFWTYGDMKLVMHWNEAAISSEGVYQYPIRDSGAWITFKYSQGEGVNKWAQFQKYVAAKASDELRVYFYDDQGVPVYGEWFSKEGESVGLYYLWPDRILIQVVNAGNIPEWLLSSYKSPLFPGIGKFKTR